jgi:hypothetical protein
MPYSNPGHRSDTASVPKGKATATTASGTLLAENHDRIAAYITNNGSKKVWLAFGGPAVAEEGPMLGPEGGAIVINEYSGQINCITKEGESLITFSVV